MNNKLAANAMMSAETQLTDNIQGAVVDKLK